MYSRSTKANSGKNPFSIVVRGSVQKDERYLINIILNKLPTKRSSVCSVRTKNERTEREINLNGTVNLLNLPEREDFVFMPRYI